MRKIVESTFMTLDGVIDEPHVWGMPYWDEEHNTYNAKLLSSADSLLLGRETYESFAEVWPQRTGDQFSDKINAMPKHVATRTLEEVTSWNASILDGDIADAVTELKKAPGQDILKYGTGELDQTLLEHGLLDELHLWVFPVIAGAGQRLLDGVIDATHLQLVDTTVFESGIVVHVYTPKSNGDVQ